MNAKSISQKAARQILKQQIVTLEKKASKGEFDIREIGDYLPGNVMVQDLDKLSNIYMNKSGCDILMHSLEELEELGPDYYTNFFPQEEFEIFMPALLALKEMQDKTRSHNFFQRVRPNKNTPYKWYLTTSKLFYLPGSDTTSCVIHTANEVANLGETACKISGLLEEGWFMKKNFQKFDQLTKREKEIISMLAYGNTTNDISGFFCISRFTVNAHRRNISEKLGIKTFAELMKYAIAYELV